MRIASGLLLLFVAVSAFAQRLHEQITVDVVEVPVHVTRGGKSIAGLTKEHFELHINGKPHPIDYFDVLDRREALADPNATQEQESESPALDRRRMFLLLFDTSGSTFIRVQRAQEAARKFVTEAPAGDTFAVARLAREGVHFIVPFTTDRVALRRAISTLRPSRAGDAFSLATLESERSIGSATGPNPQSGGEGAVTAGYTTDTPDNTDLFANAENPTPNRADLYPAAAFNALAIKAVEAIEKKHRADHQNRVTEQLAELADRLAPISGVKHVIYFAEGATGGADPTTARRMYSRFHAAGVILNAIGFEGADVAHFTSVDGRLNETPYHRSLARENDKLATLYGLALETGGTVTKVGDIGEGLRELRDMQRVTYILAFRPPSSGKEHNAISVRVRNQPFGTKVAHRRGYSTTAASDRGDGLFLADVLMNDIPQHGMTINLAVERKGDSANIVASVPGPELLAQGAGDPTPVLDVFLYVFDEKGLVVGWGSWRLRVDLEKGRDFLSENPYTIRQQFRLGAGRYSAKALLRIVGTDVKGFQQAPFEMPVL